MENKYYRVIIDGEILKIAIRGLTWKYIFLKLIIEEQTFINSEQLRTKDEQTN